MQVSSQARQNPPHGVLSRFYYRGKRGAAVATSPRDPELCQRLLCTDGDQVEATGQCQASLQDVQLLSSLMDGLYAC